MIAALTLGLLLLAQGAPPAAAPPATTPPVTVTAPPPTPAMTATEIDQLQQMYRDTCEGREYGAYDDMCDQLRQQVRAAERDAARAARAETKSRRSQPSPAKPPS